MADYKWFRSTATGKVGLYPAHFASRPTFELVTDENEAVCQDCGVTAESHPEPFVQKPKRRRSKVSDSGDVTESEDN